VKSIHKVQSSVLASGEMGVHGRTTTEGRLGIIMAPLSIVSGGMNICNYFGIWHIEEQISARQGKFTSRYCASESDVCNAERLLIKVDVTQ